MGYNMRCTYSNTIVYVLYRMPMGYQQLLQFQGTALKPTTLICETSSTNTIGYYVRLYRMPLAESAYMHMYITFGKGLKKTDSPPNPISETIKKHN